MNVEIVYDSDETCRACLLQDKHLLRPIAEVDDLYTNCTGLKVREFNIFVSSLN